PIIASWTPGTAGPWPSSSAPSWKTPRASTSPRSPRSRPLLPSSKAELTAGSRPVAAVGVVARAACGARSAHRHRPDPGGFEQAARRDAQVEVVTAPAPRPCGRRRLAGAGTERLDDLGSHLVAATGDGRAGGGLEVGGAGAERRVEVRHRGLAHAGRRRAAARARRPRARASARSAWQRGAGFAIVRRVGRRGAEGLSLLDLLVALALLALLVYLVRIDWRPAPAAPAAAAHGSTRSSRT